MWSCNRTRTEAYGQERSQLWHHPHLRQQRQSNNHKNVCKSIFSIGTLLARKLG